ncbi:hypothetical protein Godav_001682 [Gossypium davidsonii]|uniref:Uncharacterized protein n=1 Tax=Gossypium davidsonii TaxID=34287 RepID=A0A7J8T3W5_GOSDV|nr:hypothetical protein [Gossypium davidsonii]
MSLASRSDGSLSDSCHRADGIPLNLRLYEILLETCFDINDETSIIEEVDELMEHIKKTWVILGINQMLHDLCFTWGIVSLGVSAAKILVEDVSTEYRRKRKGEVDVARNRIDTYIRMEKADSSRRASKNQLNPLPILAILAKDVSELAVHEKHVFSPILKGWHPLAAGVAVATLHACYANEIKTVYIRHYGVEL